MLSACEKKRPSSNFILLAHALLLLQSLQLTAAAYDGRGDHGDAVVCSSRSAKIPHDSGTLTSSHYNPKGRRRRRMLMGLSGGSDTGSNEIDKAKAKAAASKNNAQPPRPGLFRRIIWNKDTRNIFLTASFAFGSAYIMHMTIGRYGIQGGKPLPVIEKSTKSFANILKESDGAVRGKSLSGAAAPDRGTEEGVKATDGQFSEVRDKLHLNQGYMKGLISDEGFRSSGSPFMHDKSDKATAFKAGAEEGY